MSAALVALWFVLSGVSGVAAALPDHAPVAAHEHARAPVGDVPVSGEPVPEAEPETTPETTPEAEPEPAPDPTVEPAATPDEPTATDEAATDPAAETTQAAGATDPVETAATADTAVGTDSSSAPVVTIKPSTKAEDLLAPAPATTTVEPPASVAESLTTAAQSAPTRLDASATIGPATGVVASTTESTPAAVPAVVESTASPSRVVGVVSPKPRPTLPLRPISHGTQPSAADAPLVTLPDGAIEAGVVIGMPRVSSAVGLAVEMGRAGHGWAGALVFNLWLRRQMRERRMSQRRLAMLSGVNHSTISRLLQNGRTPSLQTASKLAHALRMQWTDEQVAAYFDLLDERPITPMQRVEAALRGDEGLSDEDVRMLMSSYLKRRRAPAAGPNAPPAAVPLAEARPLRRTADP